MRSIALAFGWEFGRRLRWVVTTLAVYLVVLWAIRSLILGSGHPARIDPPNGMAALMIAPLSAMFFYFCGVFSFGLAGDLAARESIYPRRMFTLPVTTASLVGWPMLYGTAAMASLWIATVLVARGPGGLDVTLPLIWPALLASVFLAWTQALTWMPYGLPGLRVIIAVLWLAAIDATVLLAIDCKASEPLMVALLAPHLPLAYLAARVAVTRARRGDVPDWRWLVARRGRTTDVRSRMRRGFRSPVRAQTWFEWRRHGWSLPALVCIVVPFELALLFVPGDDTAPVIFSTLAAMLITPPFLAVFAAARQSYGLAPFTATRPLTSVSLIAAKLSMAIWSTLAAWLLVLVAIPAALTLSGAWRVVLDRTRPVVDAVGTLHAIVIVLLVFAGLLASTWKNLVQSLCIGLTGRAWLIKSSVVVALLLLVVVGPVAELIGTSRRVQVAFFDALPWIPVILVCIKASAAAWVALRLSDSRILSDRALLTGAACWLLAVLALYGLLVWFVATPLVPRYFLGAVAILEIPLVRLSAAPLALAWNRHR